MGKPTGMKLYVKNEELRKHKFTAHDFSHYDERDLQEAVNVLENMDAEVMKEIVDLDKKQKELKEQLGNVRGNKRILKRMLTDNEQERFKRQLFEQYGKGLPREQLEKIFSKSYERGHSSGNHEVMNEFIDLMELFD